MLGSPGSPLPTRPASRPARHHHDPLAARLRASGPGAKVNLEIKNVPGDPDYDTTPAYANSVMDAVLASRIPRSQLLIQSFIPANLDVARQRMPGVATSLLSLQAINEAFLQAAADKNYDFISPEWPVTADYVQPRARPWVSTWRPSRSTRPPTCAPRTRAKVDALITDDPLMAARALGLRPPRFFNATAFIDGRRLIATGDLLTPRGVSARQGCRGTITMRVMIGKRPTRSGARPAEPQLRVPLQHAPDPAAPGAADRDGALRRQRSPAARRSTGPKRAGLKPPVVQALSRPRASLPGGRARSSSSTGSCGSRSKTRPSRPLVVSAAQSAFRTASSVASTVAGKSGSRPPSGSAGGGGSSRAARVVVENATKISPLPWCATEPVRPGRARRAARRA